MTVFGDFRGDLLVDLIAPHQISLPSSSTLQTAHLQSFPRIPSESRLELHERATYDIG